MSYREICEEFGYSCADPDAIDNIIFEVMEANESGQYDFEEDDYLESEEDLDELEEDEDER